MKISTRGRYGTRIMIELALNLDKGPLQRSVIAKRQNLSPKYIHALLTSLVSAGLAYSVKGSRGGYVLARPPAEISLLEILETMEGPIRFVDCIDGTFPCPRKAQCGTISLWRELNDDVRGLLATKTLDGLVQLTSAAA